MSTFFIFLLFLFCILFNLFNYKKISLLTGVIGVVAYIAIGNGFSPAYLLYKLQLPYNQFHSMTWKKSNTIILLGAGTSKNPTTDKINPSALSFSRITQTAIMYRDCKKTTAHCHILISGGDPLHHGGSEARTYQTVLLSLGINLKDIQLETHSKNTYQNAKFSSYLLKKQTNEQLFLVSSGLALKRALLYFYFFNLYPQPIASDFITVPITTYPLGYNFAVNDFAIHEYIGIARFFIYNFLAGIKNNQ